MPQYKRVVCSTCHTVVKEWRQCYQCLHIWCELCHEDIEAEGKEIQHPVELKGLVKYQCPHCKYDFIIGSKYMTPFRFQKSKSCAIM